MGRFLCKIIQKDVTSSHPKDFSLKCRIFQGDLQGQNSQKNNVKSVKFQSQ